MTSRLPPCEVVVTTLLRYSGPATVLVTGYEISVIGERTDEVTTVTVGGDLVHTEVVALVQSDSYQARVTAINAAGEGSLWALPHQRSPASVAEC